MIASNSSRFCDFKRLIALSTSSKGCSIVFRIKVLEVTESSRVGSNHQGNVKCYSCGAMYEVHRLNVKPNCLAVIKSKGYPTKY
ncbi:unnamed protein product [Nippostrongylus brasiliensis]|uniref:OrfB_Zn_ribbon domain-containing protein n=1 Tax=Nippostrongylus brasiliensis TaxID=27835 RepID=A0A0N4XJG4_NIPBR|nr:unnamed protein product [Nippostrongylus brasiliensis]